VTHRPLPSGTVTFLFTDIEGSTRLLEELGDGYAGVRARHRDILVDAECVSEALTIFSDFDNQGCCAHALEAAAVVLAAAGEWAVAPELVGAAEELRRRSGQGHRPWEVRARKGAIEDRIGQVAPTGTVTVAAAAATATDALRGLTAPRDGGRRGPG
jgi:hypothetical protein